MTTRTPTTSSGTPAYGAPSQTGLHQHITSNANYNIPVLVEGVVVGIHYPANPGGGASPEPSLMRSQVTYDVDVTSVYGMGRLRFVPRVDIAAGVDDGDINILRVADASVSASAPFVPETTPGSGQHPTPRLQTTGDRVLLGFVHGNAHRPVILGVLTHFFSRLNGQGVPLKDINGNLLPGNGRLFRKMSHRGTELLVDDGGNVTVSLAALPNTSVTDSKKLLVNIGEFKVSLDNTSQPTTLHIEGPSGDVFRLTKGGLELGVGPTDFVALAPLVKNELTALRNTVNALVNAYNLHTHEVVTASVPPAPVGVATPSLTKAIPPAPVGNVESTFTKSK